MNNEQTCIGSREDGEGQEKEPLPKGKKKAGRLFVRSKEKAMAPQEVADFRGRLIRCFSYDPVTGALFRRIPFSRKLLPRSLDRYCYISFEGHVIPIHRLVWLYVTGAWPKQEIDHINGRKGDNRKDNLRDVSRRQNCQNMTRNREGYMVGATYNACCRFRPWHAKMYLNGKRLHLGSFATHLEAHEAYVAKLKSLS